MTLIGNFVTSVPSVTNVYYFFYELPRRVSFRSLRLRLRQCLLWCRVHVCCRAAVWPRICGAAHPCCRVFVMLPRVCGAAHSHTAASHGAARAAKWSQVLCVAALHSAAHLYAAASPWCRAGGQMVSVLCVAASHGAAHSHTAALHSAAHLYVAASHGAARAAKWSQFS